MTDLESQLRARLLQTFLLEASEQLSLMTRTLDELELGGDPVQPLEVFYRAAHSLKGGARIVNLPSLEYLCQSLESVLALLRRKLLMTSTLNGMEVAGVIAAVQVPVTMLFNSVYRTYKESTNA